MQKINQKSLLDAGVHFGHLKKKRNPKMTPYIFMEKKGIHLIDLNKSSEKLDEAASALKSIAHAGKKILFVATKKQAKKIVEQGARKVNMPFVTERWLGGMLTNFGTIRKSIKKMQSIETLLNDRTSHDSINKKERLTLERERVKMERVFGGITQLNRMPAAVYIVDINKEHIVLAEASKLNISTFAMVDTNSDPTLVDFPIPSNDDANKSIALITNYIVDAIQEGLEARQKERSENESKEKEAAADDKEKGDQKKSDDAKDTKERSGDKQRIRGKKLIHRKPRTGDKMDGNRPKGKQEAEKVATKGNEKADKKDNPSAKKENVPVKETAENKEVTEKETAKEQNTKASEKKDDKGKEEA